MESGLIFYCEERGVNIRVDIGDDVIISVDEISRPLCDARCIEIPVEDWRALADAINALLDRRDSQEEA